MLDVGKNTEGSPKTAKADASITKHRLLTIYNALAIQALKSSGF